MSILIKGMEMPKDGEKLYMLVFSDGKACASYKPFEWHEVVPVPPHGRCIDADAFLNTIRPICDEDANAACTFDTVKRLMIEHISDAPTIIPADKEE